LFGDSKLTLRKASTEGYPFFEEVMKMNDKKEVVVYRTTIHEMLDEPVKRRVRLSI